MEVKFVRCTRGLQGERSIHNQQYFSLISLSAMFNFLQLYIFGVLVEAKTQLGFRCASISTEFFVVLFLSPTITVGF